VATKANGYDSGGMAPVLPIYMDHHSTTPVDPRVLEAMLPYFTREFGNAASRSHAWGWRAEAAVDKAREQVAALIGAASPKEIVWTSGATESDNLAIKGVAETYRPHGNHILTCRTEHKAVLDTCKHLEQQGFQVTYLPVASDGRVALEAVRGAMKPETILVSVMLANNEIGTIQPIAEIGKICRERGVLFHCDAVQGVGKVPFDVQTMNVDLASVSAHKMYGPKGVGALFVRKDKPRVRLAAQIDGGGHERGMRSGTLNVPGIVGFGAAAEICSKEGPAESARILALREKLRTGLCSRIDRVHLNGSLEHRLPGNLNVSFEDVDGEGLMLAMKDVAVSSGAACTSASLEPSYVLRAIGVSDELANGSIRFGLGRSNTEDEVDYVIDLVARNVEKLRQIRHGGLEFGRAPPTY
jgi:cysteine desulfurase